MVNPASRRGRPRKVETDVVVLAAARRVLLENGYSGFTIEEVSRVSQVAKSSIYRRWPRKVELVLAAVFDPDPPVPASTGDPIADLFNVAGVIAVELAAPHARLAIAGVLSELPSSESNWEAVASYFESRRQVLVDFFSKARLLVVASGSPVPALVLADALFGLCVYRSATGQPLSKRDTSALIRTLLAGAGVA